MLPHRSSMYFPRTTREELDRILIDEEVLHLPHGYVGFDYCCLECS